MKYGAFLATTTATAFLFFAACGGGDGLSSSGGVGARSATYAAIDLNPGTYASTSGYGIGDGEQVGSNSQGHPLLWRGSASSVVDLQPTNGFISAEAVATSGGMQAGSGYATSGHSHALKWAGSASTLIDLDPTGSWFWSLALSISGDQVVGWGKKTGGVDPSHALLWTSRGIVDLHPNGFSDSVADATDGVQQVGGGHPAISGGAHALLWSGSADSVVDLHPRDVYVVYSVAHGVSGGQQVGATINSSARPGINSIGRWHAVLWTGTADSVVDLHPSWCRESSAVAVAAGRQVGFCVLSADGLITRALLWNGTAQSVVDVHAFLPPGFVRSEARGIDSSGTVIGSAADANGTSHAILWVPQ